MVEDPKNNRENYTIPINSKQKKKEEGSTFSSIGETAGVLQLLAFSHILAEGN